MLSSLATSSLLFGSLLSLKGVMGQVMWVLPVVLLAVLCVSLIEAFLILPHHLKHALQASENEKASTWRQHFNIAFEKLRQKVGRFADWAIQCLSLRPI